MPEGGASFYCGDIVNLKLYLKKIVERYIIELSIGVDLLDNQYLMQMWNET